MDHISEEGVSTLQCIGHWTDRIFHTPLRSTLISSQLDSHVVSWFSLYSSVSSDFYRSLTRSCEGGAP